MSIPSQTLLSLTQQLSLSGELSIKLSTRLWPSHGAHSQEMTIVWRIVRVSVGHDKANEFARHYGALSLIPGGIYASAIATFGL
jgi:hypothetical protein